MMFGYKWEGEKGKGKGKTKSLCSTLGKGGHKMETVMEQLDKAMLLGCLYTKGIGNYVGIRAR